jgi:prephenate dehydrogenase
MSAALNVATSNSRVSDEIRNANSRAIDQRDKWRRQYAELSRAIRNHKEGRSFAGDFILRTLQEKANAMMIARIKIRFDLIDTAYAYV